MIRYDKLKQTKEHARQGFSTLSNHNTPDDSSTNETPVYPTFNWKNEMWMFHCNYFANK